MPEDKARKKARDAKHYQENKAIYKLRANAWRKANPEKARAIANASNGRRTRKQSNQQRKRPPEICRKYTEAWKRNNPERYQLLHKNKKLRRRALELNCIRTATIEDLKSIRLASNGICHYCLTPANELTYDHVIPLSKGGAHSKDNIVMACRSCNCSKGAKIIRGVAAYA